MALSLPPRQLVSVEEYDRWLQRGLSVAESRCEGSYHCATPDCLGWCVYEDTVNVFHCPVCRKHNCLICKVGNTHMKHSMNIKFIRKGMMVFNKSAYIKFEDEMRKTKKRTLSLWTVC